MTTNSQSIHRTARLLALLAGASLGLQSVERSSQASIITWASPANGLADAAANWNPAQVPTATDTADFGVTGTYAVTFPATVPTTQAITMRAGTVSLIFNQPHTTGSFRVSSTPPATTAITLPTGTLSSNGSGNAVVIGATGSATMTVINGGRSLRSLSPVGDMVIGESGGGILTVSNSGLVESARSILLGLNAGSTGTVLCAGTGSAGVSTLRTTSPTTGDMVIGANGNATATARTSGLISCARDMFVGSGVGSNATLQATTAVSGGTITIGRNLEIARNLTAGVAAGTGTVMVDGTGSTITVAGVTTVGDPDGSTGTLAASNGGQFTSTGGITSLPGQAVTMISGTMTTSGTALLQGVTTMLNGTLNAADLNVSNSTNMNVSGRINANVAANTSSLASMTLNGFLDIGPTAPNGSVAWAGAINVGNNPLSARITAGTFVRLGDCTLAGGSVSLLTPGSHFEVANGDSFLGFGSVIGPSHLNTLAGPAVNASGTGIVFLGLAEGVASPLFSMTGTRVQFSGAGGGFTGQGNLNVVVASDASTVITATGPLSLGKPTAFDGVSLSGGLVVGSNSVTLRDIAQAELGGLTTINGGNLTATSSIELIGSGRLGGVGLVSAPVGNHRTTTTVAPGFAGAPGVLSIGPTYDQSDNDFGGGKLEVDIAGLAEGSWDLLRVADTATLGGRLEVHFVPPFVPHDSAFSVTVLTAGQIEREFATTNLGPLPRGSTYLRYFNDHVDVAFCPADFNHDTNLDPDDLGDYITCFFTEPPCTGADYNEDGDVNPDDLGDYITVFFFGCP